MKLESGTALTIRAVIFDLDGTLVDFNLNYKAIRAEVLGFLAKQGFPMSIFSLKERIFETLKNVEIYMKNNSMKEEEFQRIKDAVFEVANRYEFEAARKTSLLPGVLETLKALKRMGLKMALFTVNDEKPTDYVLRRFRLHQFFDAIITRESAPEVKPNPAHLEAALRALSVKPEEALVVGDSVSDMMCARGLGAIAVGVTTGISSPEDLTRAGSTFLISSLVDLPAKIQQLCVS